MLIEMTLIAAEANCGISPPAQRYCDVEYDQLFCMFPVVPLDFFPSLPQTLQFQYYKN